MYAIARFEEGICLNEKEYVLDGEDGEIMLFDTKQQARDFFYNAGGKPEDFESGFYMIEKIDSGDPHIAKS